MMTNFQLRRNFMKRMPHGLLVLVAVFLVGVSNASAQVDRATVLGTVKDTSDAVVPGAYIGEVELAGFQKRSRRVDLDTGSRTRVDFSLSIGAVEQNITVVGLSPLMNTEQSTLGTVISQPEVRQLP